MHCKELCEHGVYFSSSSMRPYPANIWSKPGCAQSSNRSVLNVGAPVQHCRLNKKLIYFKWLNFIQLFLFKKQTASYKLAETACAWRGIGTAGEQIGFHSTPLNPFQIMVRSCPQQSKAPERKKARYATATGACLPSRRRPFFFC